MVSGKKLLVMFLVFTILFSHSAVVTQAIATTSFVSIFGDAENENIEFQASLVSGEESGDAISSDVNNQDLAINLQLDVLNRGYLKNAQIEIVPEEGEDLNFAIKEDNVIAELLDVQSVEDNIIELNKIESSSEKIEISVPIEYEMEEYINEAKLLATSKVVLSGIYVDNEGEENEVSQEIPLTLAWEDGREVNLQNEVSKYIQFGDDGVILQTLVKVDSSNPDQNSLPVKETELSIDVPKINDVAPTEITVVANSTAGTNGKGVGVVEFGSDNWSYNNEENKINIKIENSKELVEINKSEDFLKVEGEETQQEERFYSVAGRDEFLVTYTFMGVELADKLETASKVQAKLTTFSGVENEKMINVATAENLGNFVLEGQTGNIVSYNIENETKEVSKSYAYLSKETEFNSKTAINISYKDIVEEVIIEDVENYYTDKSGNKVVADDVYYKQISVSQENFNEILGEEGKIEILDVSGNVLSVINKENVADENGNYVVNLQDKVSKVVIKTSAPTNTGNLILSSKKAVSNISVSKQDYANMEYLVTDTIQKGKLEFVSDVVELGNCVTKTKLNDTTTNFNLVLDRTSLSTVTLNSNVEMRLELNNDEITSDIYGASVFEIEMPEEVTALSVTNASMIYGEGLEIAGVETYARDEKIVIKVTVQGTQTDFNSGVLTNGANIVLNADITVDNYTPSVASAIKAYCYNSEATNYANATEYAINEALVTGSQETQIEYSAPSGVIAINTVKNYDAEGTTLTSIKQGERIDYIDIYSEAKNAEMELVIVNNNDNKISNLAILGRVPFEGVKDIETGDELGTTLNTKMLTGIVATEGNSEFTVYYSENGEATKDLSDSANGWVTNPTSLENVKSYLIVPSDENYKMEPKQILKFEYGYQVPENLAHNENIYGTFIAYFTNNTEVGTIDETAKPDLVGLTTGAGPELEVEMKSSVTEVKALDEIQLITIVKNVGEDVSHDVAVRIPVPSNTTFVTANANRDVTATFDGSNVITTIGKLAKDAEVEITVTLKANNISEFDVDTILVSSIVTAKDLQKEMTATTEEITIKRAELSIEQFLDHETDAGYNYKKDDRINLALYVENLTDSNKEEVVVTTKLPKEIEFSRAYMVEGTVSEGLQELENATYDAEANTVTWKLDNVEPETTETLRVVAKVGNLSEGITENKVKISSQISANETETYNAEDIEIGVGKSSLSIVQTSGTPTYVKEGDTINYTFTIKNEGASLASDVVLTDIIPDGIVVKKLSYKMPGDDVENVINISETETAELRLTVPEKAQIDVNVEAIALGLDGAQEKTVTNEGTLTSETQETITSNSVTHIIQAKESNVQNEEDVSNNNGATSTAPEGTTNGDITKSYKITGTAWIDSNSNGMRDDGEKRMSGVKALLVDSTSGIIKAIVTTNENGEYTFSGLQNGSYLVLFKYNTVLYTTTAYRKEGVESNINSDVVTTKIEQDGKKENGAVTDVININGASVSNVDIGLVEAKQFSLELDKSITKLTVQNAQGTKTETFDKTKLAKYDIAAKYLAGTTIYIEYTLTVTNNGDLEGFASEIVDYIPQGMTFNSNLNPDWYTGTDGNLYTKALANTELVQGESREIKLVLTKQMTEDNTDIVSNTAEISEDYNIYGVSDFNSKPKNKAQGEDDMNTADTILTIKTGESLIYVSAIIVSTLIGCAVAFIVYEKVLKNKRKGGV